MKGPVFLMAGYRIWSRRIRGVPDKAGPSKHLAFSILCSGANQHGDDLGPLIGLKEFVIWPCEEIQA